MVGAELGFEPVFGTTFRGGHHTGVGDEDVELGGLGEEFFCRSADTGERAEVELEEMDVWLIDEVPEGFLGFGKVACREVEGCSGGVESLRCCDTDA